MVCQELFLVVGVGLEPTFPSRAAVVLPIERPNHLFLYPYCITTWMICQELFLGAVVGVEPTFSKGERFQGCDPVVSQPFYKR